MSGKIRFIRSWVLFADSTLSPACFDKSKSCRSDRKLDTEVETPPARQARRLRLCGCYRPYLRAVAGTLAECWIESFVITISSRLNGGAAFAGKSGRKTANTCEPKATEMNMIAAAYFMSRGLIKIQKRDKKNLGAIAVIRGKGWWLVICENATSLQEKAIL